MSRCPVCHNQATTRELLKDGEMLEVGCSVCEPFVIYGPGFVIPVLDALSKSKRAALSHWIRLASKPNEPPALAKSVLDQLLPRLALPPVGEQANDLVRVLGDYLAERGPAAKVRLPLANWAAIIGATDDDGAWYVIEELLKSGILNGNVAKNFNEVGLTFKGWSLFDELQRSHSEGPIAFMAMQFGDATLERVYRDCFRPACKHTGFDLRTIVESPPAGVIDNRLRVEIRKARFVVADLTHGNQGAYWEAGFAEGLGKPVIYTCEKSVFDAKRTHFDTNHCQTIIWEDSDLPRAADQLKATIRTTLPGESSLTDR